jgi:hypothetical protein
MFSNIVGLFVVNVVRGGWVSAEECRFEQNTLTAAVIRGISNSYVEVINSTVSDNTGVLLATLASMEKSTLVVESTFFSGNTPSLAEVVVFAKSEAVVYDSCWDHNGIAVDGTSQVDHDNNYMDSPSPPSSSSSDLCDDGSIWLMRSDWHCLNENNQCPGECVEMDAKQCALHRDSPRESNSRESSGSAQMISIIYGIAAVLGLVFLTAL